jgi:serine/threonine-protein kinase
MTRPDEPRDAPSESGSDTARWQEIQRLVDGALDRPPESRGEYLDAACAGDAVLRESAARLVDACEQAARADGVLAAPASALAAPMLADLAARDAVHADEQRAALAEALRAAVAGRYAVERELGRGGMATVYLAHDLRHDRQVAVKVLERNVVAAGAERFLHEIRITARLTHPHILSVHDSGEAGDSRGHAGVGLLYYVMPYVEGETLRARLAREGALPLADAVRLVREIADALAYAHARGVVHRDLKPENVLLSDGHAVVADFGIAKALAAATVDGSATPSRTGLTSAGVSLGTPAYMAPEQAVGDVATDHRADLYALGVVAYEVLAGSHPFGVRSPQALVAAHLSETPAPLVARRPDVPHSLANVVMQLLAKDPADRPQTAGEVLRTLDATPTVVVRPSRMRPPVAAVAAAMLVVIGVGGYALWRRTSAATARPTNSAPVVAAAARPSVAVLPFQNTSRDAADEHFSDGLTDELIGALGKVDGLRVAGRTSAFALKGTRLGVRAVAETLGVGAVLEGSVRRSGGRLKVGAQLVSASDGAVLWSETYDRGQADVFTLQEEIARAIVGALRVRLDAAGGPRVRRATTDTAAYELYLKGRHVFATQTGREGHLRAERYFTEAIARDSTYARAHAGLSDVYMRMAVFGYVPPQATIPRAEAAARRAIALDSTLADAHVSLAHALCVGNFEWVEAEREFRRAAALDPGYPFLAAPYAICLSSQGRLDEGIAQLESALTRDPLNAPVLNVLGRAFVSAGRPDDAIRTLRQALDLNPLLDLGYQQLGHAYLQKGMRAEAIAVLRRAAAMSGPRDSAQLAYAYAMTGQRAEAERVVRALVDPAARRYLPPYHIAMAYTGLGDRDAAFRWLERAYTERASFMVGVKVEPGFAGLHSDPRWPRLLRRMGLEP